MVAMSTASLGGEETGLPKRQLMRMLKSMLKDPEFDTDVHRRKAKYSGMDN